MKIKNGTFFNTGNLYLLMMAAFFLLHSYNESFGLIPPIVIFRLFGVYILITIVLIVIGQLLIKDTVNAGVFSFCLLYVYFFFGAFHDFFKNNFPRTYFVRYSVFLPLIFILIVFSFIVISRAKRSFVLIKRYIIILLVLFVGVELITFIYKLINRESALNNLAVSNTVPVKENCSTPKPDIFIIVFDGYTSSQCLKEEFNYDNFEIDSLLKANNFYISVNSRSNYNMTPFSLSSTLYMQYMRAGIENGTVSSKAFLQAISTLKNNTTVDFLKNDGYVIKNYGCFDFKDAASETQPYFKDMDYRQINDQTFPARLRKDIAFNWMIRDVFTGKFKIPNAYKQTKKYHLFRNEYNFQKLLSELKSENEKPRFVYVHLMLPHEPFYLDSNGAHVSDTAIILQNQDAEKGYLDQVKYANTLLKNLIPLAAGKSNRDRVVIIEGDHGFRDYDDPAKVDNVFKNLNTYYFSDKDYSLLKENITPVNSFRVVLNKYFCQSLPLLKDSSIYLINNFNQVY